ncbi:hypothetical protein ACFQ0K_13040 [Nocardioides caeni]|uniref:Uncharacterized protein n=1 Tax=Nocardioides caeni TaxID=574700 RepID=A0A4S8NN05_9ACTN|nr:hypothetical protein [Nocardioides caeni]THV17662.1 hypothetical protein E9934_04065 [Nocardioides caeni]
MTHTTTLDKIKHLAGETLKVPAAATGAAVGLAKTAADRITGVVGSLAGGRPETGQPAPTSTAPPPTETAVAVDPEQPVNVTEELGLDPAPVAKPKKRRPAPKPVTGIDAAADTTAVDATPADIAEAVDPTRE